MFLCPRGVSRQEYWSGLPCPPPGYPPYPGLKPRSPELQVDFLLSEPPEKPKNTGVSSLSLLQGIFLTQESNQRLLHCRWILYQLSYQGSLCCTQQYCVQILYCYTYYSFINIFSVFSLFFFVYLFIFNWRMIALQCCVGFCHTSAWIGHRYTYVPSFSFLI